MSKWNVAFGGKRWNQLMKNSAKAIKEVDDVFLTEAWRGAIKLKDDLEAGYDEYIMDAKEYDIDDEQAEIYNRHSQSFHQNTRDIVGEDGTFNTLRGTNTAIKAYASYNKKTGSIKVSVTGPDILYMEYGTGDIGEATEDPEARAAGIAAGINLQPYNSGGTIRNENGYNYWTYHSSVHFGMPTGAVAYHTFQDHKKKMREATRGRLSTYMRDVCSGKDIK